MSRAARLSFAILALLAVTLAPKLLLDRLPLVPDEARFQRDLAALLDNRGYSLNRQMAAGHVVFFASKGDCRIAAGYVDHLGYSQDRLGQVTSATGPLRFYYAGHWHTGLPRLRPIVAHYWQRLRQTLGKSGSIDPVVAVASNGKCTTGQLPWQQLRLYVMPSEA